MSTLRSQKHKLRLGALGAFVGATMYKFDTQVYKLSNFNHDFITRISHITPQLSFNTHFVHFCLVVLFILVNFVKWVVFGKLTNNEIRNLKDKISYTTWEFFFGLIIFYHKNREVKVLVQHELTKFAGLFLCVLLLKCFHYLSVDRVFTIFYSQRHQSKFSFVRFATGLILLNVIDGMLIYCFFQEILHRKSYLVSIENNILVTIFGYEILNTFPLILMTTVKYGLNCYEYFQFGDLISEHELYDEISLVRWKEFKIKTTYVTEFVVNLIRFSMAVIFSGIFLYLYTFPLHILPSSYLSLRVLILKTRQLINLRKRQLQLQKLLIPGEKSNDSCIICFENFQEAPDNVRILTCNHTFHFTCLKNWTHYSSSCPICRTKI